MRLKQMPSVDTQGLLNQRHIVKTLLFAFLLLCLLPLSPLEAKTISLTDARGNIVEIPENPQRILLGIYFEDFFAVGGPKAYDRVVAISRAAWEEWRPAQWKSYVRAVPRIETLIDVGEIETGTFSFEKAIAAKPDLVIMAPWQCDMLGDRINTFKEKNIPIVVLDYNSQKIETHALSTSLLGTILGREKRAKKLVKLYTSAVNDVKRRLLKAKERPSVYVELARKGADQTDNSYGNTMWGALIEQAGGQNIAKGPVEKWGPLDPEYVLKTNPAFIFFAGSTWKNHENAILMGPGIAPTLAHRRMQPYLQRAGWNELRAVRNKDVYALYHGGARTLYDFVFLQYIAKTLHPDLFEDLDPQENLDVFFNTYMPIGFRGTYMTKMP